MWWFWERDVDLLDDNILECGNKLKSWLTENSWKLNKNKTNIIPFERQILKTKEGLKIANILGILIDKNMKNLNFSSHIETTLKSACCSLKVLTVFLIKFWEKFSFHYSKCNGVWRGTTLANFNEIFLIQKRVLHIIYKIPPNELCKELFQNAKRITLPGLHLYKYMN